MSTPPKPIASANLAPPCLPIVLPQQLPITPVRHDKDKENCFSPSSLLLPCFRLVTAELQVTLEPMDRRQAQLHYIDYKLNALQGKQREGRKRRNVNGDEKMFNPHDAPINHASIARDRENRPQQPRLTSPPKPQHNACTSTAAVAVSFPAPFTQHSGGGSVAGQSMGATRTPSRKPLLPRFPPNPLMIAKANSDTPARQRRDQ